MDDESDDEDESDTEMRLKQFSEVYRNLHEGNIKVGTQSPSCSNHQCSTCSPLYNSECEPECEPECEDEYIAHSGDTDRSEGNRKRTAEELKLEPLRLAPVEYG